MNEKVKELRELKRLAEELQAEIEGLQDAIKAEMTAQDVDTLTGADWKVTWKPVTSTHLDTAALKKALPDVAQRSVHKDHHSPPLLRGVKEKPLYSRPVKSAI